MKGVYLCIEVMRQGLSNFYSVGSPSSPYDMVFFHSLFYEVVLEKGEQQV